MMISFYVASAFSFVVVVVVVVVVSGLTVLECQEHVKERHFN